MKVFAVEQDLVSTYAGFQQLVFGPPLNKE